MSSAAIALREPLRVKCTAALAAASLVALLYAGRPVLVPLSLALLIALALAPVVDALKRWNVKTLPAVLATMAMAAALLASLALFLAGQFAELADAAPTHRDPAIAASLVEPLLNPLSSAGAAILIAALLLLNRERLSVFIAPIEAESRAYGTYLLTQGLLDLGFGVAVGAGLWLIGVPNFGLWALLGTMLRSVPFVGVAVAALCPLLLAGPPTPLAIALTMALFLAVDGALHMAERRWLGPRTLRLSAFAAVAATVLWTCLWGLTGLLLAIPLTLGVTILGRRFAPFLDRLLASSARAVEAPAIAASTDELAAARRALVATPHCAAPDPANGRVFCIAGPGMMDEAAADLLADIVRRKGLEAHVVRFADTRPDRLPLVALGGAWAVCFSATDPGDAAELRRLVRRVRPRLRSARMIAGLWGWDGHALIDLGGTAECDLVATRLTEAAGHIERLAGESVAARRIAEAA